MERVYPDPWVPRAFRVWVAKAIGSERATDRATGDLRRRKVDCWDVKGKADGVQWQKRTAASVGLALTGAASASSPRVTRTSTAPRQEAEVTQPQNAQPWSALPRLQRNAMNTFYGEVNNLGMFTDDKAFAGAIPTLRSFRVLLASGSNPSNLERSVRVYRRAEEAKLHVRLALPTYDWTSRSFSQLTQEITTLDNAYQTLKKDGVSLGAWGPDVAQNTVSVQLLPPSALSVAGLAKVTGKRVSSLRSGTEYFSVASSVAHRIVGGDFVVAGYGGSILRPVDRETSNAPWRGGQDLEMPASGGNGVPNPYYCGDGFSMEGSGGENQYVLTAGHCTLGRRGGTVVNDNTGAALGGVAETYYNNSTHDDMGTIDVGQSGDPYIWVDGADSNTTAGVYGEVAPAVDTDAALDGDVSGEAAGETVVGTDLSRPENAPNGDTYTVDHLIELSIGEQNVCVSGDSGSPIIQNTSTSGEIEAVGGITAVGTDPNNPVDQDCYGEMVGAMTSDSGGSLLEVP
jgi:hypothetical protein